MGRARRSHDGTWICSLTGHVAPAATVARLRPEDRPLGLDPGDGTRLSRCLRCDLWLRTDPPTSDDATSDVLPPIQELTLPLRDRALHDRLVLRLIALERALHVVLFASVAICAAVVEADLGRVQGWADSLLDDLTRGVAASARAGGHGFLVEELQRLTDLAPGTLWALAAASAAYATLEAVEAIGLWRGRRWAEYLTVVATVGLLPLELRELAEGFSVAKAAMLALNLAILVWIVWAKRLFGLRGGRTAGEHPTDWAAVLDDVRTSGIAARVTSAPPALPEPPQPGR